MYLLNPTYLRTCFDLQSIIPRTCLKLYQHRVVLKKAQFFIGFISFHLIHPEKSECCTKLSKIPMVWRVKGIFYDIWTRNKSIANDELLTKNRFLSRLNHKKLYSVSVEMYICHAKNGCRGKRVSPWAF